MFGIWEVEYRDGRILNEYDSNAPEFIENKEDKFGGEVPFRAIKWEQVKTLSFYNEETGRGTTLQVNVPDPASGYCLSLRRRVFSALDTLPPLSCFILLLSKIGEPVAESTIQAYYWFPDFTTHECTEFDCQDVRQWASNTRQSKAFPLPRIHETLETTADAVLS